jgi:tetratricopeptide (TPR) repeat protein
VRRPPFAALLLLAAPLAAQQPAVSSCEIDDSKGQLAIATVGLQRANSATTPADKRKAIQSAVKTADGHKEATPADRVAKAWVLGQSVMFFASIDGVADVVTRGEVGFTANAAQQIDLLATADSLFDIVDASNPACAEQTLGWRSFAPWQKVANAALRTLGEGNLDSALAYVARAEMINTTSPYTAYVRAMVAEQRDDAPGAKAAWEATLTRIGTDTSYADVKRVALENLARAAVNDQIAAPAGEQVAKARTAAAALERLIAEFPASPSVRTARNNLADMYFAAGDTAKVVAMYQHLLADVANQDDLTLVMAGVWPSRMGRTDDAIRLFRASAEKNPYNRDALFNLALTLSQAKQYEAILPVAEQFTKLDPGNPDGYLFVATAWQGRVNAAKTAAERKTATDSMLKWNDRAEKMTYRVQVTGFSAGAEETTVEGTVENRGKADATYAFTVEVLGKDGAVLGAQDVSVGGVKPNETKPFSVKVAAGGAAGFRYTAP